MYQSDFPSASTIERYHESAGLCADEDQAPVVRTLPPLEASGSRCSRCNEEHDGSPLGFALCDAASAALDYDHRESRYQSSTSRALSTTYQQAYIAYHTATVGA